MERSGFRSSARERSRSRDQPRQPAHAPPVLQGSFRSRAWTLEQDLEALRSDFEILRLGSTHVMTVLGHEPDYSAPFAALAEFVLHVQAQLRSFSARLSELQRISAEQQVLAHSRLERLEAEAAARNPDFFSSIQR